MLPLAAPLGAERVDLIDEDDAGGVGTRHLKQHTHLRTADFTDGVRLGQRLNIVLQPGTWIVHECCFG